MIAIKDMEMPKECYVCPLLDDEYGVCKIIGETKVDMTEERSKNCPLVEIVTCKDCKYYRNSLEHCTQWCMSTTDDFYCGFADMREVNEDE